MNNNNDIGRGLTTPICSFPDPVPKVDQDALFRAWVAAEELIFGKARQQETEILANSPHHLDKGNYLLRCWGGAQEYSEFKTKYGKPNEPNGRVHAWWFDSDEEREVFKQQLMEFCKTLPMVTLVYDKNSGPLVKKRITTIVTLKYLGKEYKVRKDYGYGYPLGSAIFDWEENNCSSWSNRLSYIEDEYNLEFDHDVLSETTRDYDVMVTDFEFELLD